MPDNFVHLPKIGMGNAKSKRKGRLGRTKDGSPFSSNSRDTRRSAEASRDHEVSPEIQDRWAEDEELKMLRRTIEYKPEIFILNNLMMSVQFFENYEEEIANIRQTLVSTREAELNARLPPQKHSLIPDVLQQHVARRIDFTYVQPTLKHSIELLQPIRIYIVFDNIEVTEENYASPYCSVNETVTYSMQLKPSKHQGYVKLQRLEVNPPKKTISNDDLDLTGIPNRSRDDIYSEGDSVYGSNANRIRGKSLNRLEKNLPDLNDNESIYGHRNYGSQGNLFDITRTNDVKDDNIYNASTEKSNDGRKILQDATIVTRKVNESSRGATRKTCRQYPKGKKESDTVNASPAGSTSSGYRSGNYAMDSDSDYSYAQTTYNTPKTSNSSIDNPGTISNSEIPRQCFKKLTYTADGKIYDARRERRQHLNSKELLIKRALHSRNYDVWYLNSTKFMKHFCNLFTEQLAEPMGFDPDINDETQGAVIYRDKVRVLEGTMSTNVEQFEIVPCVCSQWPECAQEWLDRPRTTWPHYNIIEKVKEFGCHMIPEGSITEKSNGSNQELEWQLMFPAAERFLETCMTYSQVKVYLIALMLHKTFIRPVDTIFGLTVSHIKNRLFWLVEEDDRQSKWMDNRIGECLLKLLTSLYRSISQDEPNLPDYFVRDKNLFQEKSYLLRTQKQLKRIIENPVMYVFHAMENIRHSRRFFPRLDYEELLRILTADTLTLVNPALAPKVTRPVPKFNGHDEDYDQVGGFWDNVKEKNKDQQKIYVRKPVNNRSLINPRKAYDQVVEIPIRCASMEPRRLSSLLDFFIRHFIKMAECCHKYRALPQKTVYVDQAERLSVLLSEHASHKDDAKAYLEKICALRKRVTTTSRSQTEPPETPRRNPDRPVFTRPLKNRYQSSEFQEQFVKIPEAGETKEYELESAAGSVYNFDKESESHKNSFVTRISVHNEDTENLDNIELRHSDNITRNDAKSSMSRVGRVFSITDTQEESFLTETTYI